MWGMHSRHWRTAISLVVAFAAVSGSLLPAYGPMLASSYAELLPGHTHVYAVSPLQAHGHSYEVAGSNGGADTTGPDGGVLALPATDDGGLIIVIVVATALLLASAALVSAPALQWAIVQRKRPTVERLAAGPDLPPPRLLLAS